MDLVAGLMDPAAYPEATSRVELVQTHISWVFLTDRFAYKVKKPVRLEFLDFSTLRQRHYYLKQELLLNRRLCPDLYLEVLPLTVRRGRLQVGGQGKPVDYALKMVRLPQERMMDEVAAAGGLSREVMERLLAVLIPFYRRAATGRHIRRYGEPSILAYNHEENFARMKSGVGQVLSPELFEEIRDYVRGFLHHRRPLLRRRLREGFIRDCHGDLHMRNICLADGIYVFDCIEFNPRFRYGDVAGDVAFLAMDLDFHGWEELSRHFTQGFAAGFPDPDLFGLLNFYCCYRACVRGKIHLLSAQEPGLTPLRREEEAALARAYFHLAGRYAREDTRWAGSWW
ncbi:MAG: hypothetical protein K6T55_10235 [Syntrophobacterales bacterium]|nr:hypothetical protein [Syntrophobacterales bacterium]